MELTDDTDTLKGENAQEEDFNQMNRLLEKLYNKLDSPTALERLKTCIVCLFLTEKTLLRTQFTPATSGSFYTIPFVTAEYLSMILILSGWLI